MLKKFDFSFPLPVLRTSFPQWGQDNKARKYRNLPPLGDMERSEEPRSASRSPIKSGIARKGDKKVLLFKLDKRNTSNYLQIIFL
jgi:hypothetical protein